MAELRRLMARAVAIPSAGTANVRFQVDVRDPQVPGLGEVRRNSRELANESVAWDDRLTVYLLGEGARLRAITVTPITVPTVYLAGDSTVADQPFDPYASWGQMLPVFLDEGVVVANHAQSGSSVRSFLAEHRFAKILSRITAGDHLLIQFGHNDMKDRTPGAVERFATELTGVIRQAQGQGASVTLLTSMERHRFVQGRTQETLGAYPATVRRVAATTGCALVDLHTMSRTLYETLGEAGSSRLFKPAGPGDRDFDHTHHSTFGAYEIARCVCQGLAHVGHPLARHLRPGAVPFDPAHPDDPAAVVVPLSSLPAPTRPLGD
jgi:lysophospholipase L1-like esterase